MNSHGGTQDDNLPYVSFALNLCNEVKSSAKGQRCMPYAISN